MVIISSPLSILDMALLPFLLAVARMRQGANTICERCIPREVGMPSDTGEVETHWRSGGVTLVVASQYRRVPELQNGTESSDNRRNDVVRSFPFVDTCGFAAWPSRLQIAGDRRFIWGL